MPLNIEKIKRLRESMKLSQDEAAIRMGFRWSQQLSDIERGRHTNVTIETLERVAAALGVKAKDLLK